MPTPPSLDQAVLDALFPPVVPDNPDPHVFELGLVLGGTVSAGAYTAGALDFLLEALEALRADPAAHRVVVKTAGGSSGGAVCASILGLLSSRAVAHVAADQTPKGAEPAPTGNPLWDLWVNEFRIERLLSTGDIDANQDADAGTGAAVTPVQHVPALLNCQMIDAAAATLAQIGATSGQALPYFAAPFRVAVTLANLRGIPYKILNIPTLGDFSGAAYVQHDDFAWFAFPNGVNPAAALPVGRRPDEFWLDAGGGPDVVGPNVVGYDTLVSYATASGAVPVGLAARALSRPSEHYCYRPVVRPVQDQASGYRVDWPQPDWSGLPDAESGVYAFTAVDGGTFNNDPVSLVHRAIAGLVGHNPRGKSDAKRAIFMIDPLADKVKPIARVGKSLLAVAGNIIGAEVGAARYLTADMELFADADVFSRFQLVPFRPNEPGKVGEAALAGASLYAAAGWCAREFRVHDYLLGRHNMQVYLRRELVLSGDNTLFDGWTVAQRQDWALDKHGERARIQANTPASSYLLPVVPDKTGAPLPLPAWPTGAYDPETLRPLLTRRLDAVLGTLLSDNGGTGALPWLIGIFAIDGVADYVAGKIIGDFKSELAAAGL